MGIEVGKTAKRKLCTLSNLSRSDACTYQDLANSEHNIHIKAFVGKQKQKYLQENKKREGDLFAAGRNVRCSFFQTLQHSQDVATERDTPLAFH